MADAKKDQRKRRKKTDAWGEMQLCCRTAQRVQ